MKSEMTIRKVARQFDISARTLRYWEQAGLIESERMPENAYRYYAPETVSRVAQICVLRSLHVPIREIKDVLDDPTALTLLDTLKNSLKRMDGEMEALQKARDALQSLAMQVHLHTLHALPDGEDALCLLETLSETLNRSEENTNMSDLKKSDFVPHENVEVRFIDLPPMTVAAAQYTGDEPENHAQAMLEDFIEKADLVNKMPGLRMFGFNNPSPEKPDDVYGYEFWVTIPESMEVPAPLEKKTFEGGLYAAHAIRTGDFQEWGIFYRRMQNDPDYEVNAREPFAMGGCLEEHLNVRGYFAQEKGKREIQQIDLLIPVKVKA